MRPKARAGDRRVSPPATEPWHATPRTSAILTYTGQS